jgi:c-di-GMP-related signal transduction protein
VTQHTVHVGRQPVFDARLQVRGYELLFRAGPAADSADLHEAQADFATADVIVNTFAQFGIRSLVGSGLAFVNVTRTFLTGELPLPFRPDGVVLEVLADTYPDPHVVEGCHHLVDAGYRLALDDLLPGDPRLALLPLASYVKLDVRGRRADDVAEVASACLARDVALVGTKVETEADLDAAWALGCTLFQGHHLARAHVVGTPSLTPDRLHCLRLLGLLAQPAASLDDIDELVRLEPALAVRLLTVVNSAAVGARREISSVRDALVMVGLDKLREWLQLMVLADLAGEPSELFSAALVRARACEMLATGRPGMDGDSAFTTGLVSSLDVLLDQPLEWVVTRLGLREDLRLALTAGAGPLGELLGAVRGYERGTAAATADYASAELAQAFLAGVEWTGRREPEVFVGGAQPHRLVRSRPARAGYLAAAR